MPSPHEDILVCPRPRPAAGAAAVVRVVLAGVRAWHQRARQRRALARLTDRQLADVGLTRAEAEREAAKLFWRD